MSDDVQHGDPIETPDTHDAPEAQMDRHDTPQDRDEPREKSYTDRTVPYSRFREVNEQNKRLKKDQENLAQRLEELEGRDQSELERERKKRQQYERELAELSDRATRVERQSWIRDAARDLKFDDPDDAIAFVNYGDVEDYDDAMSQVKALAKRKPRLLRQSDPTPKVGQVMENGQRVPQQQGQRQPQTAESLDAGSREFLDQLQTAQRNAGWQSIPFS